MKRKRTHKKGLAIWRLKCFYETIVLQTFILAISFSIAYGQGLTSGSDVDGTPRAIAGNGVLFQAQGRQLALTDAATGLQTGNLTDTSNPSLISSWNNGGYLVNMQDGKFYKIENGPHLLALQNNKSFAKLKTGNDISNNLMAHWTFDSDANNNIFDSTSNAFHGKGYNIQYEDGPVSKAAVFNGTDSRIDFPEMGTIPPAKIGNLDFGSISLWFKFQNQGGDILPLFYFGESDPSLPHNSLIVEIGHNQDIGDSRLYFTIIVAPYNVTRFCFDNGFNLQENTWYHFTAVVSNEGNTGYLNGVELTGRRYNLNSGTNYTDFFAQVTAKKQLSLGNGRYGRNTSFFYFKGSLDDVRIYGRALTVAEVQSLYSLGKTTSIAGNTFQNEKNLSVKNFPNPFNLSTTLSWRSEVSGHTILVIYDIMGRKIETLVNEFRHQGIYNMVFDGMDLPSGVYYAKLQVGNNKSIVKMMIIKQLASNQLGFVWEYRNST